ncbi:MAG: hypothetical protein P0S95_05995 [Rhabdochlamydiaceae bacterium]|nr:hypothetical protein [Candidatus Amphrikana amoebophyrae]
MASINRLRHALSKSSYCEFEVQAHSKIRFFVDGVQTILSQTHYVPTTKGLTLHATRVKKEEGLLIEIVSSETIVKRLLKAKKATSIEPFALIYTSCWNGHVIPLYCHMSKKDGKLYVLELDSVGHGPQALDLERVKEQLAGDEDIVYLTNRTARQASPFGCHIDAFETLIFTYRFTKDIDHILDEITMDPLTEGTYLVPIHWTPAVQILPKTMEPHHLAKRVDDEGRTVMQVIKAHSRRIKSAKGVVSKEIRFYLNDKEKLYHSNLVTDVASLDIVNNAQRFSTLAINRAVSKQVEASNMAFKLTHSVIDGALQKVKGYSEKRVFDFLITKGFSEKTLRQSYNKSREKGEDWIGKLLKSRRVKGVLNQFILHEIFTCDDPSSSPFLKCLVHITKIELPLQSMNYGRDFKVINNKLRKMLPYFKNLRVINLIGVDQQFLNELAIHCPKIKKLSLDSATNEVIPATFTMLTELVVRHGHELLRIEPTSIKNFRVYDSDHILHFIPASGATGEIELFSEELLSLLSKYDGVDVTDRNKPFSFSDSESD